MNCEKVQQNLASMVFGELDNDLKQKVSAHLDKCEKCRAMHDDMAATVKIMQEAFQNEPAQVLAPPYRDAINQEIRGSLQDQSPKGGWRRFLTIPKESSVTPAKFLWRMAAVFVALLLLAGLLTTPTLKKAIKRPSQLSFEQTQMDKNYQAEGEEMAIPEPLAELPLAAKPKSKALATTSDEHVRAMRSADRESAVRDQHQGDNSTERGDAIFADAAKIPAEAEKKEELQISGAGKKGLGMAQKTAGEEAGIAADDKNRKTALSTRAVSDRYSTFSMDPNTASFRIARRYLAQNQMPPASAIRVEDFVNVFDYNYPTDTERVFGIFAEGGPSPFRKELKLVKIGVQGRVVGRANQNIAKDTKIQVEFNPSQVRRYRLLGYENRDIEDDKFRDNSVDAGEIGSGQSVTALYEVELQPPADGAKTQNTAALATVYVRYRDLDTGKAEEVSRKLDTGIILNRELDSDPSFFLAACAAEFAEILRGSEYAADTSFADIVTYLEKITAALPRDDKVRELLAMVRSAKTLQPTGGE